MGLISLGHLEAPITNGTNAAKWDYQINALGPSSQMLNMSPHICHEPMWHREKAKGRIEGITKQMDCGFEGFED